MLVKPPSCRGCPLFPLSTGFMQPSLAANPYGVALVGEALGEQEAELGGPFVGKAGFKLTRLLEWAGLDRARFDIWNVVWCRPPGNLLNDQPYEKGAVYHCRDKHWGRYTERARVIVPMGNVALAAFTGYKGILAQRGYIQQRSDVLLLPTVHPSFIQRGQAKYSRPFINDVSKAVELAQRGFPAESFRYVLDPSPAEALKWAATYRAAWELDRSLRLSFDIETPGKGEDEAENSEEDDPTYIIWRIGFSYRPFEALSIPWTPEYMAAIRLLMESPGEKVVWNASFDIPRILSHGIGVNGLVHDGMVAWHILHSDLPKGLKFVATFACPWQPHWKHLANSRPAFYNATDADVEIRSMLWIEQRLRAEGLWRVYERDVIELDPILVHFNKMGMPIDAEVRYDRAVKLGLRRTEVLAELEAMVPLEARTYSPDNGYIKEPDDTNGCIQIDVRANVKRCSRCGLVNPTKPHFKTYKKPTAKRPQNPCSGAEKVEGEETVRRWARLDGFTPSRHQLMRYQLAVKRPIPTQYDKKTQSRKPSMNEKSLKLLMKRYPEDTLYPLVLDYRMLDKLAGTYIGRPADDGLRL